VYILAGTNNNTSASILLHNAVNNIGLPSSLTFQKYGTNISFLYIKDSVNDDRILVKALVGAEIF
jgi:hypothetical protein